MITRTTGRSKRRRYARVPCRMIVQRVGPTVDLSEGGVRILSANPLPKGADLPLEFELPEIAETVRCRGSVVHVSPSRFDRELVEIGVAFQDLTPTGHEQILSFVAARADYAEEVQ